MERTSGVLVRHLVIQAQIQPTFSYLQRTLEKKNRSTHENENIRICCPRVLHRAIEVGVANEGMEVATARVSRWRWSKWVRVFTRNCAVVIGDGCCVHCELTINCVGLPVTVRVWRVPNRANVRRVHAANKTLARGRRVVVERDMQIGPVPVPVGSWGRSF